MLFPFPPIVFELPAVLFLVMWFVVQFLNGLGTLPIFGAAGLTGPYQRAVAKRLIDAAISLPLNVFYGAGVPACLLILRKQRPAERRDRVLLIYAARHYRELSAQNELRPQDVMRMLVHVHAYGDVCPEARGIIHLGATSCDITASIGTSITAIGTRCRPRYDPFFTTMAPVERSTCAMSWLKSRISSRRMLMWLFTRASAFWWETYL